MEATGNFVFLAKLSSHQEHDVVGLLGLAGENRVKANGSPMSTASAWKQSSDFSWSGEPLLSAACQMLWSLGTQHRDRIFFQMMCSCSSGADTGKACGLCW